MQRDDLISVSKGMCVLLWRLSVCMFEFSADDLAKVLDRKCQQLTHIRQSILSHDADKRRLMLMPILLLHTMKSRSSREDERGMSDAILTQGYYSWIHKFIINVHVTYMIILGIYTSISYRGRVPHCTIDLVATLNKYSSQNLQKEECQCLVQFA